MKNTINVIDQELIDDVSTMIEDGYIVFDKSSKLLTMAKDLIEINAEITKENQSLKGAVKFICSEDELRDLDESSNHWRIIDNALKGQWK